MATLVNDLNSFVSVNTEATVSHKQRSLSTSVGSLASFSALSHVRDPSTTAS